MVPQIIVKHSQLIVLMAEVNYLQQKLALAFCPDPLLKVPKHHYKISKSQFLNACEKSRMQTIDSSVKRKSLHLFMKIVYIEQSRFNKLNTKQHQGQQRMSLKAQNSFRT